MDDSVHTCMYLHMYTCSKLRAKLGLKPLDVGGSKAISKESGQRNGKANGQGELEGE